MNGISQVREIFLTQTSTNKMIERNITAVLQLMHQIDAKEHSMGATIHTTS